MSKSAVAQAFALALRSDGLRYSKPPVTPPTLSAVVNSTSQITVTAIGATSSLGTVSLYRWQRNGVIINGGTPSTSPLVDSGLLPGTPYSYTAAAVDSSGNESGLAVVVAATTNPSADTIAPTVPGSFNVSTLSANGLRCVWLASTDTGGSGFSNYSLERSSDGVAGWVQVFSGALTTFDDLGLAPSTRSYYRVRARDNAGNFSAYSAIASAVTAAGAGFARKPIVPTPSIKSGPGFGRTIYVDFDAGNDANDGLTTSTPWRTIDYLESNKLAGDLIYMKGTTSGVNSYFGKGTTTGTSSAWITYTLWPNSTLTFMNGGLPNAYNAIFGGNLVYHCFYNLPLDGTSGASLGWDSGGICQLTGSSNVWFIGCTFNNTAFRCLNTPDCRLYDCTWTGSFGDFVNNTGDMCYMANSSHRFWLIRNHFDVRSGHGCCDLGNPTSGSTICNDPYVFDCYFKNPAAGGFYFVGDCRNAIAEWNTMEYMGTDQGAAFVGSTDGCQLTAPGTIFRFNIVKNNFRHGAIIDSTEAFGGQFAINNHIYNNVFYNNGNIGNAIKPAQGGQGIYHGGGAGNMNCQTGWANNTIENNIFWGNGTFTDGSNNNPNYSSGYYNGAYHQIWVDEYNVTGTTWATGNIYGNIWRNNIYGGAVGDPRTSTGFYLLVRAAGNEVLSKTAFEAAHPECTNNKVHQDPLFVDAPNGNFRLQAGSPARNAGFSASGLTFLESAPDIGVYEYGGSD